MDSSSQETLDENFKKRVNNLTTYNVSVIATNKEERDSKFKELENFDVINLTDDQKKYFNNTLRKNNLYRANRNDLRNTDYKDFFKKYSNMVITKTSDYKPAIGGKSHRRKKSKSLSKSRSKSRGKSRKLDKSHGKSKHK